MELLPFDFDNAGVSFIARAAAADGLLYAGSYDIFDVLSQPLYARRRIDGYFAMLRFITEYDAIFGIEKFCNVLLGGMPDGAFTSINFNEALRASYCNTFDYMQLSCERRNVLAISASMDITPFYLRGFARR